MSDLVEHAKTELALAGNDDDFNDSLIGAVEAFASFGHSGGSAFVATDLLVRLLRFQNLTPLTSDASEWVDVSEASGIPMWQNNRNYEAFSEDGGKTYRLLSDNDTLITAEERK